MTLYFFLVTFISRFWTFFKKKSNEPLDIPFEGLRGILALSVFFHHGNIYYNFRKTGVWSYPNSYFYGQLGSVSVTLFFFISGFLFWSKLLNSQGNIDIINFFRNRTRRVVPVAYFSIALIAFIALYETDFKLKVSCLEFMKSIGQRLIFGLSLSVTDINGFKNSNLINAGIFWTLFYEWLFYLSLPFLGWFAKKQRTFLLICGVWTAYYYLSLNNFVNRSAKHEWAIYAKTIFEYLRWITFGFGFGILGAWINKLIPLDKPLTHFWASSLFVVLFFFGVFPGATTLQRYGFLFGAFILIAYGNDLFGLLSSHSMKVLGRISYSIYLFHGIVLWLLQRFQAEDPIKHWCFVGGAGLITILFSMLSYQFIEFPFLKKKIKLFH